MFSRAAVGVFCVLTPALAQNAGVVDGSVIDSATHSGIAGVTVKLFTPLGVRYETTTDGTGQFSVHGMKEDEYDSSFAREGFAPPDASRAMIVKRLLRVDGKKPARLDVEMIPYGKIRGRVVDADGKPAPNVPMTIEGPLPRPPAKQATDIEGNFAFDKLLPGSYAILAKPKPAPPEKETADARNEAVATYFPSAIERAQALPVIVRAGADVSGTEIQLRRIPVYRVRGVVLDETGKPAANVAVGLHPRDDTSGSSGEFNLGGSRTYFPALGSGPAIENTVTNADGAFEFTSVHEGDWLIRAESEWGYIEETKRDIQAVGSLLVSVSKKNVDDIRMRLATNFNLPLTIDFEDAPGAKGRSELSPLILLLFPEDGGPAVFGMPGKDGDLLIDRAYPGRYRVVAQTRRPGFYVASVDYAGRPVSGQMVELEAGAQPLHVILRNHAGQARGVIEKGQAATVLLLSASIVEKDIVQSVECAAGALFQFDNLHPGAYEIVAFDRVDEAKFHDPAFLARVHTMTKSISVEEGANPSLELPINRWPD